MGKHRAADWLLHPRSVPRNTDPSNVLAAVNHELWMERAACTSADPECWFPTAGGHNRHVKTAMALCRACPVREACLEYALSLPHDLSGIWGGLTEHERRPLRAARNRA